MKNKGLKNLKLSKVAIAKISLNQREVLKGGTMPTSEDFNSTGLHSQCEHEMCR
ncbi:hypothetical protein [Kordia sp.]|uniref:hypothetical protein n=1 Tax=Kordia sp. TaxID=1965332 RepID=UPI003B5A294E